MSRGAVAAHPGTFWPYGFRLRHGKEQGKRASNTTIAYTAVRCCTPPPCPLVSWARCDALGLKSGDPTSGPARRGVASHRVPWAWRTAVCRVVSTATVVCRRDAVGSLSVSLLPLVGTRPDRCIAWSSRGARHRAKRSASRVPSRACFGFFVDIRRSCATTYVQGRICTLHVNTLYGRRRPIGRYMQFRASLAILKCYVVPSRARGTVLFCFYQGVEWSFNVTS